MFEVCKGLGLRAVNSPIGTSSMKTPKLIAAMVAASATSVALTALPATAALMAGDCAGGCSLKRINDAGGLQIEDKIFSGFTAAITGTNPAANPAPPVSALDLVKLTPSLFSSATNVGFSINTFLEGAGNTFMDLGLGYRVKVADDFPTMFLTSVSTNLIGYTTGAGEISIAENVYDASNNALLASIFSVNNAAFVASSTFSPVKEALVQKNIKAAGNGSTQAGLANTAAGIPNVAHLSIVNNLHGQTAVPTPALLPGLMGFGITLLRKRTKEAVAA
jgi:hypothetical protein